MSANYYNVNLVNLGASERRIAQKAVAAHREAIATTVPAATPDGPAMVFIGQNNAEWGIMWQKLGEHPLNKGIRRPSEAYSPSSGESWQYMGTIGGEMHQFRHRCHPSTKQREYVHIPVS